MKPKMTDEELKTHGTRMWQNKDLMMCATELESELNRSVINFCKKCDNLNLDFNEAMIMESYFIKRFIMRYFGSCEPWMKTPKAQRGYFNSFINILRDEMEAKYGTTDKTNVT